MNHGQPVRTRTVSAWLRFNTMLISLSLLLCSPETALAQADICTGSDYDGKACSDSAECKPGGTCDFSASYELPWSTRDGRGEMYSTVGAFRRAFTDGRACRRNTGRSR